MTPEIGRRTLQILKECVVSAADITALTTA